MHHLFTSRALASSFFKRAYQPVVTTRRPRFPVSDTARAFRVLELVPTGVSKPPSLSRHARQQRKVDRPRKAWGSSTETKAVTLMDQQRIKGVVIAADLRSLTGFMPRFQHYVCNVRIRFRSINALHV